MAKNLLVTIEYPPAIGGVASYYSALVESWPNKGAILVLTNPVSAKHGFEADAWRVKRRKLLFKWLRPKWLPLLWQTIKLVKRESIGLMMVGQVLPVGYAALIAKRTMKVPFIVFTHGLDIHLPQANKWKKYWLLKILSEAKRIAANSQFTKNELLKLGFPDKKIVVVYPVTDTEIFRPLAAETETSTPLYPYILSVGRLVRRKGFDAVIEVLPRVLKNAPEVRYLIAGRGPDKDYLMARASQNGVSERVIFLDCVSHDQLLKLYQQASVVAMPYRQIGADVEGFGIVLLEAASCGKPVVAGDSGGASEAIKHGYSGFLVASDSADQLSQALIKILTDQDFARRLGEYGRRMVQEKFAIEKEIEKLYYAKS